MSETRSADYTQRYAQLHVTALTPEQHERTCGYWYVVGNGSLSHTAFATRRGLERWLTERGLSLSEALPAERGIFATFPIIGEYISTSHGEFSPTMENPYRMIAGETWAELEPIVITAEMSNGRHTLALITSDAAGIRTVHTLNCNVKDRIEVSTLPGYRAMAELMS